MTCQLPEGARVVRNDAGEAIIRHPEYDGVILNDWMQSNCAPGTEVELIQNGYGDICLVAFRPPTAYSVDDPRTTGRRFRLIRHEDVSGVSGVGVVAHGVQWPDGTCSLRWSVPNLDPSFANWDGIEAVERVHGHHGKTELEWID